GDPRVPEAYVLTAPFALEESVAWARGRAMGQSRASMLPARVLEPRPGERVLDLCAAPGAKATHLAALARNGPPVPAVDLRAAREGGRGARGGASGRGAGRAPRARGRARGPGRSGGGGRAVGGARGRLRRRAHRPAVHGPRHALGPSRRALAPPRGVPGVAGRAPAGRPRPGARVCAAGRPRRVLHLHPAPRGERGGGGRRGRSRRGSLGALPRPGPPAPP